VENITWLERPNFPIDQRINPDNDSDSDGMNFPPALNYTLLVSLRNSVYLQYVVVPESNVNYLHVIVYLSEGTIPYHSERTSNPVVRDFLATERTRMFEVQLKSTTDGKPPTSVTLEVVSRV
jgi:hypothetical protein